MTPEEMHTHRRAEDPILITLRDVYDKVTEVSKTVDEVANAGKHSTKHAADHELRIRSLERWAYALPAALVLAAVALIAPIIGKW